MKAYRRLLWEILGVAILAGCTIALCTVHDNLWVVTMGASWWLTWHAMTKAIQG